MLVVGKMFSEGALCLNFSFLLKESAIFPDQEVTGRKIVGES